MKRLLKGLKLAKSETLENVDIISKGKWRLLVIYHNLKKCVFMSEGFNLYANYRAKTMGTTQEYWFLQNWVKECYPEYDIEMF